MTDTALAGSSASVEIDAQTLRTMRQERGLTQVMLATLSGLSFQYISQLETGYRSRVSPPTFIALCDALRIRPKQRGILRKMVEA